MVLGEKHFLVTRVQYIPQGVSFDRIRFSTVRRLQLASWGISVQWGLTLLCDQH